MFGILWQLIVGLIVGVIARVILPGKEPIAPGALGWLITALIGMGGALLGTFIGRFFVAGTDYRAGIIMSIIGAVLLLLIVRLIFRKSS